MLIGPLSRPLPIGRQTRFGRITAVGMTGGERYYWLIDKAGTVSMHPWFIVEPTSDTNLIFEGSVMKGLAG